MPTENRTTLTPDTPVRYLKGVGPKTAERFEKLGIVTLADLLCHYPRRYIDFSKPYSIAEAPADTECVVKAEVFAKPGGRILPGGRRMERITAGDDVASLEITWFNNPYATQKLQLGQEYYFQGIVTGGMLRRQMVNPQVRTAEQIQAAPFEAVYPQTEGLSSSVISRCIRQLLPHAELLPDPLPPEMLQKYRLLPKAEAVRAIHCPATEEQAAAARRRLIYEELLVLQLGIGRMRSRGAAATGAPMRRADPAPFWQSLPFAPTGAQRRAVVKISYINSLKDSGTNNVEWSEILYKYLSENHEKDIIRQATSFGPHKDDIEIFLDEMNVRNYGSQGQQRSCALSLKIGEATILKNLSGEQPIALMDDVMSELDENRQKYLMKFFDGWQVFVTCCDLSHKSKINSDKVFEICDGRIV